MDTIEKWLQDFLHCNSHVTHIIAVVATGLGAAYMGYQPFHDLVARYYGMVPPDGKVLMGTAGFMIALYRNGQKKSVPKTEQA